MRSRQGSTATSRRLHVVTSPSHDVEVNYYRSKNSPRRDVTTSRRHYVATSTKKFCISSLNARRLGNLGHIGVCAARDTNLETCNTDLKILLGFFVLDSIYLFVGYFWII